MDAVEKLRLLGPATRFEPAEEVIGARRPSSLRRVDDLAECVHNAVMPGGKRIALGHGEQLRVHVGELPNANRLVVHEFPSREAVEAWVEDVKANREQLHTLGAPMCSHRAAFAKVVGQIEASKDATKSRTIVAEARRLASRYTRRLAFEARKEILAKNPELASLAELFSAAA